MRCGTEAGTLYGPLAADHLRAPRNLGKLAGADGVGQVDDPTTDTVLTIYLIVSQRAGGSQVVDRATFRAFGCSGCIVAGSALTELATGLALADALLIQPAMIHGAIAHGLPSEQTFCADLAVQALQRAIAAIGST